MKLKTKVLFAVPVILMAALFLSVAVAMESDKKPAPEKKAVKKTAPKMLHDPTLPGELCVTCHMESAEPDPESITPKINNKHEVCNKCHKPDGSTVSGHCGCEDASDPMDCETCHTTPAMGDNPSAEDMNDLCLACH
jgi:hypothetical protein